MMQQQNASRTCPPRMIYYKEDMTKLNIRVNKLDKDIDEIYMLFLGVGVPVTLFLVLRSS